jgi:hypothetical protein
MKRNSSVPRELTAPRPRSDGGWGAPARLRRSEIRPRRGPAHSLNIIYTGGAKLVGVPIAKLSEAHVRATGEAVFCRTLWKLPCVWLVWPVFPTLPFCGYDLLLSVSLPDEHRR